jgi:hypothetical protein
VAATSITPAQQQAALSAAAGKYGIPEGILNGVYGMETGYGANITTSSGGAVGPFQFLPSTASRYGYPLTNTPSLAQFQQQADAAAHYLSDLFHQRGGSNRGGSNFISAWDAALHAYSGGGYGYAQVNAKSGHGPLQSIVSPPSLITQAANTVGNVASGIGNIADLVTSGAFWLRVLEALGGIVLLVLGLVSLAGGSPSTITAAAAKAVK